MAIAEKHLTDLLSIDTLSDSEIIRIIRLSIAAEIDATNLYQQIAEATNNELIKKVMTEIADEERVHIGEFLRLLQELDPKEIEHYNDGAKEVEMMITGKDVEPAQEQPVVQTMYPAEMGFEGKESLKKMIKTVQSLDEEINSIMGK